MKVHKGISAVAVVLVGLLGMVGCGGGDSTMSKAEYQQKLEAACKQGLKERNQLFQKLSQTYPEQTQNASAKEVAELQADNTRKLMALYQGTTEEIAALGLPEQGKQKAEEFVSEREKGVAKIESNPQQAITEFATIMARPNKIAEDFFKAPSCAE